MTSAREPQRIAKLETSPLSERARIAILEAILENKFEGRLPAEDELARMLDVSRTTIRTALHSLEQDGVITRQRAIGTTINRHVPAATLALQHLVGFDWLLRAQGYQLDVRVSAERADPPAAFTDHLELDGANYLMTDKQYFADGRMVLYVRDAIPTTQLDAELTAPLPASLFEFTKRFCRRPINHAVARITGAVKGDARYDTKLELDPGQPFTRLFETHYGSDAAVAAHSVIDVDDRLVELQVFRREPF